MERIDLDADEIDPDLNDSDPFISIGSLSDGKESSEVDEEEKMDLMGGVLMAEQELERTPVFNEAGVDISDFINQDFHKPVPLYRHATIKELKSNSDNEDDTPNFESINEPPLKKQKTSIQRDVTKSSGSLPSCFKSNLSAGHSFKYQMSFKSEKSSYNELVRSGTIKVPNRQSLLEEK